MVLKYPSLLDQLKDIGICADRKGDYVKGTFENNK